MVKNKHSLGIMQGRLSPPMDRGIQFFPFDEWQEEFKKSAGLGLDEIEFIFDLYKYRQNPLWSKRGRNKINNLVKTTGVRVNSICADYFMRRPFFRVSRRIYKSNLSILKRLIKYAAEIGANLIEIPLVDNSSIKTKEEESVLIETIRKCIPEIKKYNVRIGLEVDLPPKRFFSLLQKLNHPMVGANYDTGNSASLGFNPAEEMKLFGKYVFNIHIKDRLLKGGTVSLGTGNAKFRLFFNSLGKLGYNSSFILQAARGEAGKEEKTISEQIRFLKKWI